MMLGEFIDIWERFVGASQRLNISTLKFRVTNAIHLALSSHLDVSQWTFWRDHAIRPWEAVTMTTCYLFENFCFSFL